MILGILNVGSHDTLGANGHHRGYLMCVMDNFGQKFYVDINENTYADLVGIISVSVQKFQGVSMGTATRAPSPKVGEEPTGSEEEVEQMRQLLKQASRINVQPEEDVMKKLGFVSDEVMQQPYPQDPVDEVFAMASSDDDDEYEDPGEESFGDDVESL